MPWSIGAWWPAQEAYAGAARTTRTLVAAGLAFGAACLLFAWFWLERATSPLERLRHEVDAGMPIHTPPAPIGRPILSESPAPGPLARLADLAQPDTRTFDPATEVGALAGSVGRLVQYWERALGAAEQEAAFFRAIAEQAPVGLAFLDRSLAVPFANVRFERLVGASSATIVRALHDGDSTTTSLRRKPWRPCCGNCPACRWRWRTAPW